LFARQGRVDGGILSEVRDADSHGWQHHHHYYYNSTTDPGFELFSSFPSPGGGSSGGSGSSSRRDMCCKCCKGCWAAFSRSALALFNLIDTLGGLIAMAYGIYLAVSANSETTTADHTVQLT